MNKTSELGSLINGKIEAIIETLTIADKSIVDIVLSEYSAIDLDDLKSILTEKAKTITESVSTLSESEHQLLVEAGKIKAAAKVARRIFKPAPKAPSKLLGAAKTAGKVIAGTAAVVVIGSGVFIAMTAFALLSWISKNLKMAVRTKERAIEAKKNGDLATSAKLEKQLSILNGNISRAQSVLNSKVSKMTPEKKAEFLKLKAEQLA